METTPFSVRKHPGFEGVTIKIESVIKEHGDPMVVGHGELADELTSSWQKGYGRGRG